MTIPAAGPLGKIVGAGDVISVSGKPAGTGASSLIMLNRLAFVTDGKIDEDAGRALLRWASGTGLGQDDQQVRQVADRRARAVAALRASGQAVGRLRAEPEWRLAAGIGNRANAHEIGLSLHGTYGWPVIPGSSLKGLAAAWAAASDADAAEVAKVFGGPRPPAGTDQPRQPRERRTARRGSVRFLDAIPADGPVRVVLDVLTPHVKPYYDKTVPASGTAVARSAGGQPDTAHPGRARPAGGGRLPAPAEHHNPVPISFLTVTGAFAVDLYGPDAGDVAKAAQWLIDAGAELGAGAKTAAGYGYLKLTWLERPEDLR